MDRIEEASSVIIDINKYRIGELEDFNLIKSVCSYFDKIKDENPSSSELVFLKHISSFIGIPHFYDLLEKFDNTTAIPFVNLDTISALIYESTLNLSETNKVHRYQKQILNQFSPEKSNKYFLSASTSFGKTHIVYEIIRKMNYQNVLLVFPTIALLSENLEKLTENDEYENLSNDYNIHTLSDVETLGEKNLFIYTPERFLSFIEKNVDSINLDFVFIDEIYKIDNDYIIDEEVRENERDVAYRLAVHYSLIPDADILLAGPYIDFSNPDSNNYNNSFDNFLKINKIELINYNNYEIVNKSYTSIQGKRKYEIEEGFNLEFDSASKNKRLISILQKIDSRNENSIVYCYSRTSTESYARKIIESKSEHDTSQYSEFLDHIANEFSKEWIVIQALSLGVGIHHGLVPKYIQKEIVSLFNKGFINVLVSTTTITEGVNTSAKNLIVVHSKKGNKPLKKFDAKNIAGRAGRFLYHFSGRVIALKNDFIDIIESDSEGIKHKNYDIDSPKDEIDLYYTNDEFLTEANQSTKIRISQLQEERHIPDRVFGLYKVVSRINKITIYDSIKSLSEEELESIKKLIRTINFRMDIDYDGFQLILNILEPIVKNQKLKFLIEYKGVNNDYSTLTHLIHFYLKGGFRGSVNFKLGKGLNIDKAISETSEFVFNILKYQVVKYLGVFNIMYKFFIGQKTNQLEEEVSGLDRLLTKLEYNAFTEKGRIASDFGVPSAIVDYYENEENSTEIKSNFDPYEERIFGKIENIINEKDTGGNKR